MTGARAATGVAGEPDSDRSRDSRRTETIGAAGDPLLTVTDLAVGFETARGVVRAVDGVSFTIGRGESVGVVGESGSGKSVTAMALMGLLPPYARTTGSIRFDGTEVLAQSPRALRRLRGGRIGMVFQDPNASLNPVRTVGAQLIETLRVLRDTGRAAARSSAVDLLDQVGLPEPRRQLAAYPHELSGGMRQRVMIALAMAGEPELLIADEATTALDVSVQAQILVLLGQLIAERGMSLLVITHDLGVAATVSDRIAVMYSGRLAEVGDSDAVFSDPTHPYTYALMRCIPSLDAPLDQAMTSIAGQAPDPLHRPSGCAFSDRCPLVVDRCRAERPALTARPGQDSHRSACWVTEGSTVPLAQRISSTTAPVGSAEEVEGAEEVERNGRLGPIPDGEAGSDRAVLRVRDLEVRYRVRQPFLSRAPRRLVAVRGVDLEIPSGRTLGLVGESGSGKSSTARAVLMLEPHTTGSVSYFGRELTGLPERQLRPLRTQLQMIMQDITTSLSPRFTVEEAISEPLRAHRINPPGGRRAHVASLLRDVSLPADAAGRMARELSGGQRQRVNLARALSTDPDLIVADEPTSALDVSVRAQILNLMRRVQAGRGLSYLFISHDLTVIRQMCDTVAVMYLGKVVETGEKDRIFAEPRHPYTRALLAAVPRIGQHNLTAIAGELPSPLTPPSGCPFRTRCPKAQAICAEREPQLEGADGQAVACFFPEGPGTAPARSREGTR
jgi:oligopeptide/dipeptide ABC transporter ATP-binding protein